MRFDGYGREMKMNNNRRKGMSLIEVLLGLTLFVLIFSHVMTAFAPTATDYQRLVRGYTTGINVANWYFNHIEGIINYEGDLPASELGVQRDVTSLIRQKYGKAFNELPDGKVLVNISRAGSGLYQVDLTLNWGGEGKSRHTYSISRLKSVSRY